VIVLMMGNMWYTQRYSNAIESRHPMTLSGARSSQQAVIAYIQQAPSNLWLQDLAQDMAEMDEEDIRLALCAIWHLQMHAVLCGKRSKRS